VAIELQGAHRDLVDARADTLDRVASERENGAVLDTVAKQLALPIGHARVIEGQKLLLGRWQIPDVSVWAFETKVGETSPVIEAEPAYYVFRLDSLTPAGVPPLARVRDQVAQSVRLEKKQAIARQRAEQIAAELRSAPDLARAAAAAHLPVVTLGPFTRLNPPDLVRREPLVLGAAFGLRVGERSGLIAGEHGYYLVESIARKQADSTAWLAQRDQQRQQVLQPARQARMQAYLTGLRQQAKVVDRRKELFRPQQDATAGT
jgi:hypothetical protein